MQSFHCLRILIPREKMLIAQIDTQGIRILAEIETPLRITHKSSNKNKVITLADRRELGLNPPINGRSFYLVKKYKMKHAIGNAHTRLLRQ